MNYNPYADHKSFTGKFDMMSETVPTKSCFACFNDELCLYQESDAISYPMVINNVVNNNITSLDKKIVSLVATYGFATSKQLSEFLTLLGIEYSDSVFKSSLERLKRNQIIRACRFGIDEQHCAKFFAYSLNKNGSDIAKALGIPHAYAPMQPAILPSEIKKVLATNQVMLAYLKSGMKLEWMRRGQVITAKEDKSAVVRPSMAVAVNGDVIMIEVVRQGEFWKQYLSEKLQRYKALIDSWTSNSWSLSELPLVVISGENTEHNLQIAAIAATVGIDVYFTEDTLNCGASFYHSIYKFNQALEPDYFCFEQEGQDAA